MVGEKLASSCITFLSYILYHLHILFIQAVNTVLTIVTMIANSSVYYVPGTALTASETSTHTIVATASGGRDVADDETKCKAHSWTGVLPVPCLRIFALSNVCGGNTCRTGVFLWSMIKKRVANDERKCPRGVREWGSGLMAGVDLVQKEGPLL